MEKPYIFQWMIWGVKTPYFLVQHLKMITDWGQDPRNESYPPVWLVWKNGPGGGWKGELGRSWVDLGAFWRDLGVILGWSWGFLGGSWGVLDAKDDGFDCREPPYLDCIQWQVDSRARAEFIKFSDDCWGRWFTILLSRDKHQNQRNKRYIVANRIEAKW